MRSVWTSQARASAAARARVASASGEVATSYYTANERVLCYVCVNVRRERDAARACVRPRPVLKRSEPAEPERERARERPERRGV